VTSNGAASRSDDDEHSCQGACTARRRRLLLIVGGLVAAIAVTVGVGLVITDGSTDGTDATPTGQLASLERVRNQWRASIDSSAPTASWCSAMTGWMSQQVQSRHMAGPMMWADPDQMLVTCRRWMTSATRDTNAAGCDQMVAWINTHTDGRRNWTMNLPMIGG
jgi:hypothetical protein